MFALGLVASLALLAGFARAESTTTVTVRTTSTSTATCFSPSSRLVTPAESTPYSDCLAIAIGTTITTNVHGTATLYEGDQGTVVWATTTSWVTENAARATGKSGARRLPSRADEQVSAGRHLRPCWDSPASSEQPATRRSPRRPNLSGAT